jgi:hypothetical protein
MDTFLSVVGFFGALVVLCLAAVGLVAIISRISRVGDERQRWQSRANEAEQQIMEIGRQAQVALLGEALRRVHRDGNRGTDDPPEASR